KVGSAAEREPVSAAMSMTLATVTPEEEVADAALRLIGRGASCLIVMDGGRMVGVLTTTDLVQHLAEAPREPAATGITVQDIMHKRPITVAADDYLMDALARMAEHNIRHLPVIDGVERVIGMLSDRDIRTAIGDPTQAVRLERTRVRMQSLRVSDLMSQ